MHNDSISRNLQGQAIEIHGHKKTETIMAKFENTDGSLANEVVTSADTPSSEQDRDEYYDDFDFLIFYQEDVMNLFFLIKIILVKLYLIKKILQ